MKIVQFGLPYSPNLGDGVIAECLAHGLRVSAPGTEVTTVDISGRRGFGDVTVRNRALALRLLGAMPAGLRGRLVQHRLSSLLRGQERGWRAALDGADLAVVGGGQLFSDADLNFPTKIGFVADLLVQAGLPVVVHAAGVSRNWSRRGAGLFSRLLDADLRIVGLRDEPSIEAWTAQTGGAGPTPTLTRDPGLLAQRCYGVVSEPGAERVGLCVTDPGILRYHADEPVAGAGGLEFLADVATALVRGGSRVTLFCNGAAEDREALVRIAAMPGLARLLADGAIHAAKPPETPGELVRQIAGTRCVIAHRLHACIVARALGVPAVGLGWDRKVESFFASLGEERYFEGRADTPAPRIAELAMDSIASGAPEAALATAVAEAQSALAAIAPACGIAG